MKSDLTSYTNSLPLSPYNSVNEMIDVLRKKPFLTENELTWAAFDYDRNCNGGSNKKYADMLRRGLHKGIIKRIEAKVEGKRAKFFYYIPGQEECEGIAFALRESLGTRFSGYLEERVDYLEEFNADCERIKKMEKENKDQVEEYVGDMEYLKNQKDEIKEIINSIVKTHNNYTMWENSEIETAGFILNLLEIVSDYSVRKVIPFYGNGWVSYLRDNLKNELPKNSSGSFYTSLIDFDNFFLEGVFEMILERGMLEPTEERVDYLSEFAWKEYDKIRPSLYTSEPIVNYITDSYIIEPLEITGIPNGDTISDTDDEEIRDIPGFEGVLAALDNLTSEFRTYIGAPGNEIG